MTEDSKTPALNLRGSASDGGESRALSLCGGKGAGQEKDGLRPRRVLFFGKRKSRSACTGALVDALRKNGLEVRWVNCSTIKRWVTKVPMRSVVRWIYRRYQPDLIFVFFHDLPAVLMREFSPLTPTVVWMEEALQQITRSQLEYVRDAKLLCLSSPDLVEAYQDNGIPHASFQLSGFSPAFHKPHSSVAGRPRKYDRDLAYIGGPGEIEDRPGFLAWLAGKGLDLEIFGLKDTWLPYLRKYPQLRYAGEARPSRYSEICARSRVVIGLNQAHDSWLYFSNRIFLTLACQGFHLTHYVPGIDQVFERGVHLDWFEDREECLERIDYWLGSEEERHQIAQRGLELVRSEHTYERRVREVLEILAGDREPSCPQPKSPSVLHPFRRPELVYAGDSLARTIKRYPEGELLAVRVRRRDLGSL
ncbi:MAG: hypothetical protein CSA62_14250 [Planctomycetota bacterium]|nr:MAG: hypothetical protein CSA62_14250 [Planctomycetota bacterium]